MFLVDPYRRRAAKMAAAVERLLALGARAYVTKPLDIVRFLTVVDDCLGGGELWPLARP